MISVKTLARTMSKLQGDSFFMKYLIITIVILIGTFISCESLNLKDIKCVKLNACQCAFPNGEGIDLSKLTEASPSNWLNSSNGQSIIYFNPCLNVPMGGVNECSNGSSLCHYNSTSNNFTLLGRAEDANFLSEGVNSPIFIQYKHNNIETTVSLHCNFPTLISTLEILNTSGSLPNNYKLTLHSPMACITKVTSGTSDIDHSLSTGSILVILFFTFFAVYFFIGALVLKVTRGAEGKELIPNYDFWAGLPSLCRDGVMFVMSGFKPARTYDSI